MIEKQDAISEFLYEEGDIPDFSDLENGEDFALIIWMNKNQKAEWQDSKIDGNIEKRQGNLKSKREDDFNEQFMKEIRHSIRKAFIKMGTIVGAVVLIGTVCRSLYPSESSLKILLRSKRSSRSV